VPVAPEDGVCNSDKSPVGNGDPSNSQGKIPRQRAEVEDRVRRVAPSVREDSAGHAGGAVLVEDAAEKGHAPGPGRAGDHGVVAVEAAALDRDGPVAVGGQPAPDQRTVLDKGAVADLHDRGVASTLIAPPFPAAALRRKVLSLIVSLAMSRGRLDGDRPALLRVGFIEEVRLPTKRQPSTTAADPMATFVFRKIAPPLKFALSLSRKTQLRMVGAAPLSMRMALVFARLIVNPSIPPRW